MPIRKEYVAEVQKLKTDTFRMGELSKGALENVITALRQRDAELASKVLKDNVVIDKLEFDIEGRCMNLIALQQPMAIDLRTIGTCLKIITDFDRISDLAGNIAEIVIQIADEPFCKPLIDIPRMAEIAQAMIADCLDAFENQSIDKLCDFSERDDLIDGLLDQVRRELLTVMIERPKTITNASHLLFVGLHLERIGDHACNIASRIIYMVTGKRQKLE